MYTNPVIPDTRLADPQVIRYEGTYYLYATGGKSGGYDVWTSPDLVHWTKGPRVFTAEAKHVWAPEVYHHPETGKFYLYYSVDFTVGTAVADTPLGPFTRPEDLVENAIDAHPFRDADGRLYLYYVAMDGFRICVLPMDDPLTPAGEPTELIRPTESWEMRGGKITEGPAVVRHDGRYYMLYSGSPADRRDYAVGYAVSDSPTGPFRKFDGNPILSGDQRSTFGPGHGSVIADDAGRLWHVYHQKAGPERGWNRFICIDPLWFDAQARLHGRVTRGEPMEAPQVEPDLPSPTGQTRQERTEAP